jgi:HPt (histidine-containing phosphotransfer) domain-containing protein
LNDVQDKTVTLLAALWLRNLPVVEERVATLDRAAEAMIAGVVDGTLRAEAAGCAHKLAGSLGMYGYDEGTRIARELETLLNGVSPCGVRMQTLVDELRVAVFPVD